MPSIHPHAEAPDSVSLVVVTGSHVGRRFDIGDRTIVGRSEDADVLLEDAEVSRLHARLERVDDETYVLEDLGSSNGTFVNGVRVSKTRVGVHDRIGLGGRLTLILARRDGDVVRAHSPRRARTADGTTNVPELLREALAAVDEARALPPEAAKARDAALAIAQDALEHALRHAERTEQGHAGDRARSRCDVSALCESVLSRVEGALPRHVRVRHAIDPGLCGAVDAEGLRSVLTELCVNARDALFDSGVLEVWARARGTTQLSIGIVCQPGPADTYGPGEPRAFPSRRALKHARTWAERHGGTLTRERTGDGGGRVELQLPGRVPRRGRRTTRSAQPPAPTPTRATREPKAPAAAPTILVVDDERGVRRSVGRILERAGYNVRQAADGREAIEAYDSADGRPELVLMDLHMPNMDGAEAMERLRTIDRSAKVVVASGELDDDGERNLRAAGAVGALRKPFASSSLVESVRRALREQPADLERHSAPPPSVRAADATQGSAPGPMQPPIRRPSQLPRARRSAYPRR